MEMLKIIASLEQTVEEEKECFATSPPDKELARRHQTGLPMSCLTMCAISWAPLAFVL